MVEVNGKQYADTVEYALDTHKYDKVIDEHTKTINVSPCWTNWVGVVEKNRAAFEKMSVDEIDNAFHWFEGGFSWGMLLGMKMAG